MKPHSLLDVSSWNHTSKNCHFLQLILTFTIEPIFWSDWKFESLAQELLPQQDSKSNAAHFIISVLCFVQQPSRTIKQRKKVLRILLRCRMPPAATHSIKWLILQHDHNAYMLYFPSFAPFLLVSLDIIFRCLHPAQLFTFFDLQFSFSLLILTLLLLCKTSDPPLNLQSDPFPS